MAAAESVKLRSRYDFIEGENVWVDAKYFDDPKSAPENCFSATCDRVYGVITLVASKTCKVLFNDGSTSYVAKEKLNLVGQANIVNTGNKGGNKNGEESESESEKGDTEEEQEWRPEVDGDISEDEDEESEVFIMFFSSNLNEFSLH